MAANINFSKKLTHMQNHFWAIGIVPYKIKFKTNEVTYGLYMKVNFTEFCACQ
jgi:hypothetical protein